MEALKGSPLTKIKIIGGGSKNVLLNQLCADTCRVPVSAGPAETSAIGNICVQLIALGALRDLDDAGASSAGRFHRRIHAARSGPGHGVDAIQHLQTPEANERIRS